MVPWNSLDADAMLGFPIFISGQSGQNLNQLFGYFPLVLTYVLDNCISRSNNVKHSLLRALQHLITISKQFLATFIKIHWRE